MHFRTKDESEKIQFFGLTDQGETSLTRTYTGKLGSNNSRLKGLGGAELRTVFMTRQKGSLIMICGVRSHGCLHERTNMMEVHYS